MIKINYPAQVNNQPEGILAKEMKDGCAYIDVQHIGVETPCIFICNRLSIKDLAAVSLCGSVVLDLDDTGRYVPVDIEVTYKGLSKS